MIPFLHLSAPAPLRVQAFSHSKIPNGLRVSVAGVTKNIVFFSPDTVRVNTNLGRSFAEHPSLSVVAKPKPLRLSVKDASNHLVLTSSALSVSVDKKTGVLTFARPDG